MDFHRRKRVDANIDMTPMIDALLQLFVVFMLNMSFLVSAVQLNLPRASAASSATDATIVVSLDATNRMLVNSEPVTHGELPNRLQALLARSDQRRVVLRADRSLSYEKVLETLITIQKAGVAQVQLAYESLGQDP